MSETNRECRKCGTIYNPNGLTSGWNDAGKCASCGGDEFKNTTDEMENWDKLKQEAFGHGASDVIKIVQLLEKKKIKRDTLNDIADIIIENSVIYPNLYRSVLITLRIILCII